MYCITSSPNFITNFAFNSENVGDENLNTYLLNWSLIFEITTPTVLLKFRTTESKSVIENLPFIKETDYDRKAENIFLAVIIWLLCVFNCTSWTFLGKPNHKTLESVRNK